MTSVTAGALEPPIARKAGLGVQTAACLLIVLLRCFKAKQPNTIPVPQEV